MNPNCNVATPVLIPESPHPHPHHRAGVKFSEASKIKLRASLKASWARRKAAKEFQPKILKSPALSSEAYPPQKTEEEVSIYKQIHSDAPALDRSSYTAAENLLANYVRVLWQFAYKAGVSAECLTKLVADQKPK
jgi:hypothetical protein